MKDEISYLMTLEKRLESVMDTGKPDEHNLPEGYSESISSI